MRARYLGPPVSSWYGRDLLPGQVLDLPEALAHKACPPLFEAVGDPDPAEVGPAHEPRRRGRPRKTAE